MKIIVIDHAGDDTPQTFEGNPLNVEMGLRKAFRASLHHVPRGDMREILDVLSHMYGLEVYIDEPLPLRRASKRPQGELDDPWPREIDDIPEE